MQAAPSEHHKILNKQELYSFCPMDYFIIPKNLHILFWHSCRTVALQKFFCSSLSTKLFPESYSFAASFVITLTHLHLCANLLAKPRSQSHIWLTVSTIKENKEHIWINVYAFLKTTWQFLLWRVLDRTLFCCVRDFCVAVRTLRKVR